MDKITTNQKEKQHRDDTRFIIVPVKKYLANFLIYRDWKLIQHSDPIHEIAIHFAYKEPFWQLIDTGFKLVELLLSERVIKQNPIVSIGLYRNRRKLDPILKDYVEKGYSLIKINVKVLGSLNKVSNKKRIVKEIDEFNLLAASIFKNFCLDFIEGQSPKNALDYIFLLLKIQKKDLNKNSIIRYYNRKKIYGKNVYFRHLIKCEIVSTLQDTETIKYLSNYL